MKKRIMILALGALLLAGTAARAQGIDIELPAATFDGGSVTNPVLLPDGSGTAPGLAFTNAPNYGFYYSGGAINVAIANGPDFVFTGSNLQIRNDAGALYFGTSNDLAIARDAANTLALRNGTNAQTFNIYNTYTDPSNYERGTLVWSGNEFFIGTQYDGTGSTRVTSMLVGGSRQWTFSESAFYPGITDSDDLGQAAQGIKNAYILRSIQGSKTKALTESSATTVFTIALADKAVTSGTVMWAVHAADATNTQMVSNEFGFDCLNEADTEACTINNHGTDTDNTPTGTLTCTDAWAYGTNTASFTLNCVSSLTQTTLNAYVRLDMLVPQTLTFP